LTPKVEKGIAFILITINIKQKNSKIET